MTLLSENRWKMEIENQKNWFIYLIDHHEGPFSVTDIKGLMDNGKATPVNYVWKDGMVDWVVMTEVEEFRSLLEPASVIPPTPPSNGELLSSAERGLTQDISSTFHPETEKHEPTEEIEHEVTQEIRPEITQEIRPEPTEEIDLSPLQSPENAAQPEEVYNAVADQPVETVPEIFQPEETTPVETEASEESESGSSSEGVDLEFHTVSETDTDFEEPPVEDFVEQEDSPVNEFNTQENELNPMEVGDPAGIEPMEIDEPASYEPPVTVDPIPQATTTSAIPGRPVAMDSKKAEKVE